jgi:hypothetical protein
MLTTREAIEAVIDLVPNWYIAEDGFHKFELNLEGLTVSFVSHRALTPDLKSLLENINSFLPDLFERTKDLPKPTAIEIIQEYFAVIWLSNKDANIEWKELLEYASSISLRTYENQNITFNFIISEGNGTTDITSPEIQKYIDPLASSPQTYIRIDRNLKFLNYEEIKWSDIKDTKEYKFNPEFLQPIKSVLKSNEYSIHLTSRSDIIIMNISGLLAAKRKRRWKLYDVFTLKNFFVDKLGGAYRTGSNIFDVLFDLSFKRHGALLVYDPEKNLIQHIINKGSITSEQNNDKDSAREMLSPPLSKISMSQKEYSPRKKRLFLEIASMDGAVIFNESGILAFGAMIETHTKANSEAGARSTAARSAFYWGGYPIKISSDGEITIYFKGYKGKKSYLITTEFL